MNNLIVNDSFIRDKKTYAKKRINDPSISYIKKRNMTPRCKYFQRKFNGRKVYESCKFIDYDHRNIKRTWNNINEHDTLTQIHTLRLSSFGCTAKVLTEDGKFTQCGRMKHSNHRFCPEHSAMKSFIHDAYKDASNKIDRRRSLKYNKTKAWQLLGLYVRFALTYYDGVDLNHYNYHIMPIRNYLGIDMSKSFVEIKEALNAHYTNEMKKEAIRHKIRMNRNNSPFNKSYN